MKHSRLLSCLIATILFTALGARAQEQAEKLFPVNKDGKWGYIDRTGKVVIPLQFASANDFHEGLALVTSGGKKVFIDASGGVVIKAQFDIVDDFSEGVAAVNIGQTQIPNLGLIAKPGKWGYLDKAGKLVIPMKFTYAEDFSEGLAAVKDGDRGGFIDHTGKMLFEVPLDVTLGFREGIVGVLYRGSITYFDRRGRKLPITTDYGPKSNSFSEGLLPIETKGKWGFVNPTGKLVIEAKFEDADNFSEGLAPVKVHRKETVWCPPDASGSRSGSMMMYGYIDKTGKLVIPAVFNSVAPFAEGVAVVSTCDQAFFIDRTGKTVISGNFSDAFSFSGGLAHVRIQIEGVWMNGLIDKAGKFVWGPNK